MAVRKLGNHRRVALTIHELFLVLGAALLFIFSLVAAQPRCEIKSAL